MSILLFFPIVIIFILGFNLGLPLILKRLNLKPKLIPPIIFIITLIFAPGLGNILLWLINESLKGQSGGLGLIGVGLLAGLFLIFNVLLFIIINFVWMIVRLVRKPPS
jgi:hypothetical protein